MTFVSVCGIHFVTGLGIAFKKIILKHQQNADMQKILIIALSLYSITSFTQIKPRDNFDPEVTELWSPKPPKVTPGNYINEAPSDAIILFDGKDLSQWTNENGSDPKWEVKDGAVTVKPGSGAIKTKQKFGDIQLHLEWRSPAVIKGSGQDRGNSGVFLQERYELQVLDSYENETYVNGQAGSLYKQAIPLVNATKKPGEWQSYDIMYTAPRFSDKGELIIPAYITVIHNGVLIQNHVAFHGGVQYRGLPFYEQHGKASLQLQDHDCLVSYRNIWIREL